MSDEELMDEFKREVLEKGPESTLPSGLSDKWLATLSTQAEEMIGGTRNSGTPEVVAALVHVLLAKYGHEKTVIGTEELHEYFQQYRIELALEGIRRYTEMKLPAATIDTIFTERNLDVP